MDVIFDLFGIPVPVGRGKRGRPEHVPTLKNRNLVKMLLAIGWSNDRIANALAITLPTLRKHYFSELKARAAMRDRMDARRLERAWLAAETGNVGAMKEYDRLLEKNDLMQAQQSFVQGEEKPDTPKRGKKEQAAIDAETAGEGSEWGDDLIFRDGKSVN